MEDLFDCDMFVFCASRSVPEVGSNVTDVRMIQYESNSKIIEPYARMAREKGFKGIFAVVSDPVDQLCYRVYHSSNIDENGKFDGKGLQAEQVRGYGLGVMLLERPIMPTNTIFHLNREEPMVHMEKN